MKIGVLALQGDFDAHRRRLEELGAEVVLVRKPEQFDEIDGLVIPGGESTTFLKLLGQDTFQKLSDFVHTKPTFGTCAGAIIRISPASMRLTLQSAATLTGARSIPPLSKLPLRSAAIRLRWSSFGRRGSKKLARA
jgi:glutamine amidotransferase PdxT